MIIHEMEILVSGTAVAFAVARTKDGVASTLN